MASDAVRGFIDGKSVQEVASKALGQAVFFGITKAIAYLGWGRKALQEKMARAERDRYNEALSTKDGEVIEAQPVEKEAEEVMPAGDVENEVQRLKEELDEAYKNPQ